MAGHFGYTASIPEKVTNRGANRRNLHPCAWHRGLDVRVTDIRAGDLSTFLGKLSFLKPLSFNTLGGVHPATLRPGRGRQDHFRVSIHGGDEQAQEGAEGTPANTGGRAI
jgi:hypothetical protein